LNIKYDFHSHTSYSDGVLTPTELVLRAAERQVQMLAISDHDCVSGLSEARRSIESNQLDLQLINSIELSAQSDFGEIHIVGLNIDPTETALVAAINKQQSSRWVRAQKIADKLESLNVLGVFEYLQNNCREVVTRSHIAKSLVELNHVKDMQQAFKKYLGKKGRVKVVAEWLDMSESIKLIHNAGGLAILAHPTRYPMSNRKLTYLIEEFKLAGGDAMEVSYPSLVPDKQVWLYQLLEKHELLASAGSDFHYPNLKWSDLGHFKPVRSDAPHVLQMLLS
jgi:3',5'-nucleoside bisphosphate phosphatase